MQSSLARWLPWLLLVGIGATYGVAFLLPAVALATKGDEPGVPFPGHEAYRWAWSLRATVWLANPLCWLAAGLLAARLWRWAGIVATAAFAVALESFLRRVFGTSGTQHALGYWLWAGSMATLALVGLVGGRLLSATSQRSIRSLFTGRRGVGLGAGTGVLLAGFAVLWYWPALDPTRENAEEKIQVHTFQVGDLEFQLEQKGYAGRFSVGYGKDSLRGDIGPHEIVYADGILLVNNVEYGSLGPADRVFLTYKGEVRVNDQPRLPYPIQLRAITPPATALAGHTADTWTVAWASTGRTLVSASCDRSARIWDVSLGKERHQLKHDGEVLRAALSPDGRRLVTSAPFDTLILWDATTGQRLETWQGPKGYVGGLAFLDDDWLVAAHGHTLYARNLSGDRTKAEPLAPVHGSYNRPFAVSEDGRVLVCCDGQKARGFRLACGKDGCKASPGFTLDNISANACVAVSRDGTLLALFDGDRRLRIHDAATGDPKTLLRWRDQPGIARQISTMAFTPDGKTLAVGDTGTVRLYEVATGRERVWFTPGDPQTRWVRCLTFSPDGRTLAASLGEGPGPYVKLWEVTALLGTP